MSYERKFDVALTAVIENLTRLGITSVKFSYSEINEYANGIARALVIGEGTRDASVLGMRFVSGEFHDYVVKD